MYAYKLDEETGGFLLTDTEEKMSKEPRPVWAPEMKILGFDQFWKFENQEKTPYLIAEAGNYFYRGRKIAVIRGGSLYEKPTLEVLDDSDEFLLPIDVERMTEKNFQIMESLRQATIKRIYNYWMKMKNRLDCFHVAFSGGKDSIVLLDLVKHALPKSSFIVVFGDTHMEFPDTYKIVDEVERQCKNEEIEFYRAESKFEPEETWRIFGPPSTVLRWCCSVHKSAPQTLKIREVLNKSNFVGADFVGVRAQESIKRSNYDVENVGMKQRGQHSHNSILEWGSAEIWIYIFMQKLLINRSYKLGNSRAGCLMCPMSSHRKNFFNRNTYPTETQKYIDLIRELINPIRIIDFESYLSFNGWNSRKNGMDLNEPLDNYSEEIVDGYLFITVKNPKTDWREWMKTIGDFDFPYEVEELKDRTIIAKVKLIYDKTPSMKIFKSIFHKSAVCVGCGVCEANCRQGAISFKKGFQIDKKKCIHCLQCHNIESGCYRYDSTRLPKTGGLSTVKGLNTFSNHAPKPEWIKDFFSDPNAFLESNNLGTEQIRRFRVFLYDAELLDKKNKAVTDFTELVKKIGWNSATAWGLILINLVYNNPQIRWYIENMPINEQFDRSFLEEKLSDLEVSKGNILSIINAFKRLCEIPLGTELKFGSTSSEKNSLSTLKRTKCKIDDSRVILYSLFKFAEAADWYQFTLSRLENDSNSDGVSPMRIFGIEREEMQQFLNGLSTNYPDFISATFTHDLEKISLSSEKSSRDVLNLFKEEK